MYINVKIEELYAPDWAGGAAGAEAGDVPAPARRRGGAWQRCGCGPAGGGPGAQAQWLPADRVQRCRSEIWRCISHHIGTPAPCVYFNSFPPRSFSTF